MMKKILFLILLTGLLLFLFGCGSDSSSNKKIELPQMQNLAIQKNTGEVISSNILESGLSYKLCYEVDTDVIVDTESSVYDSITIACYLLHNDSSIETYDYKNSSAVGANIFNPDGGEIEIVLPEDCDTAVYKLVTYIDPLEFFTISNRNACNVVSDTFALTDEIDQLVEIKNFESVSNVAIWTDSDYTYYGKPQVFKSIITDTSTDDTTVAADTTVIYETQTVSLPTHIQINADIILRGKAAQTTDTTYVGFYIEYWQDEYSGDTSVESTFDTTNIWADLLVIDRDSSTKVTSDSPEKLMFYYPISRSEDTEPNQEISITVDLRIPNDTDIKNIDPEYHQSVQYPGSAIDKIKKMQENHGYTVWRVVMFAQNVEQGIYQPDFNARETYYAFDYVRIMKAEAKDMFPDGSRNAPPAQKYLSQYAWDQQEQSEKYAYDYHLARATFVNHNTSHLEHLSIIDIYGTLKGERKKISRLLTSFQAYPGENAHENSCYLIRAYRLKKDQFKEIYTKLKYKSGSKSKQLEANYSGWRDKKFYGKKIFFVGLWIPVKAGLSIYAYYSYDNEVCISGYRELLRNRGLTIVDGTLTLSNSLYAKGEAGAAFLGCGASVLGKNYMFENDLNLYARSECVESPRRYYYNARDRISSVYKYAHGKLQFIVKVFFIPVLKITLVRFKGWERRDDPLFDSDNLSYVSKKYCIY